MNATTLTLFYDGLCPLCSREIDHYRRRAAGDPLVVFVDITDPVFDAAAHGLDAGRIHRTMHVKVGDEVRTGVDAFIAIWDHLAGLRWLARVARFPGVYHLLRIGYALFARARPLLPHRRRSCPDDVCPR